ncbi:DUF2125 domain-containing protein [Thioclava kandeliae]|uniref:DUF2125 domain-containing protein n=1 Tax=Thioclava kandeliae TaxID=3070818 RepID=A0ABV1SJP8_9RHOB
MARITGVAVTATCLAMIGSAGFADVTAQDVWDNVQDLYRGMGFEVSAQSVTPTEKGLTVSGITLARDNNVTDEVKTSNSFTVPQIEFIEIGDGRVRVDVSDQIKGVGKTVGGDGKDLVSSTTEFDLTGDDIVASGDPKNVHYQMGLEALTLGMRQTVHQPEADFPTDLTFGLTGVKGDYTVDLREGSQQTGSYHIDSASLNGKGTDPAGGSFTVSGGAQQIDSKMATAIPAGVKLEAVGAYGAPGVSSQLDSTTGPIKLDLETQSEDGDAKIHFAADHGSQTVSMMDGTARYHAVGDAIKMDVLAPNMPFEASFGLDYAEGGLSFPTTKGDALKPFGVDLALKGVTLDDQIWRMLDPQGKLPHDPAQLELKLSGHAKVNQDLFDENFGQLPVSPGELRDLNLDLLHLNAVGLDLTGNGAVTFDGASAMPWPVGKVHLALSGAKGLMGTLTEMGLLPQDQAMFAQMILGLYAKPTGDDAMETDLEFTQDGHILANGQTIQ